MAKLGNKVMFSDNMYSNIRSFFVKKQTSNVFLIGIVALIFILYAIRFDTPPFFSGDAEHYWKLGSTFFRNGPFDFLGGEPTFRGYMLPLILGVIQFVANVFEWNPFKLFYVINSVLISVAICLIIPNLVERIFSVNVILRQRIIFCMFFLFFWRGYVVEPLSDAWSLFLLLVSTAALLQAAESTTRRALLLCFISGLCLAAAVNLRPIYLICTPFFVIGFAFIGFNLRSALLKYGPAFMLGFVVAVAPQAALNKQNLGSWDPFTHSGSLYIQQLFFGLTVMRHECAYFVDPSGVELLKKFNIQFLTKGSDGDYLFAMDVAKLSLGQYINIVLNNPIDVFIIYVRHIFNGTALLGSNIYHCVPSSPRYVFMALSSFAVFLAAAGIILMRPKIVSRRFYIFILAPFVPVALTIPTAMEGRFFFAVHIAAYAVLCFLLPWSSLRASLRGRTTLAVSFVAACTLLAATVMSSTFASTFIWLGATETAVRLRAATFLLQP